MILYISNAYPKINRNISFSSQFKSISELFIIELKKGNVLINGERFKRFFMSQVDKLEDLNEKNILAEMINLANAYNLYFFSESNSLRLDRLEKSGLFDSIKNPNQLMRLFPAMTVAGYIVTQVVAFVVGYLTSYVISNIFGCTSEDTLCTILHGVMWGVYFALGAHFGMCQEELLPWQWQSGNVRLGCFGNILALNKVEKVPFQIQILSC